jgi:two-component system CheB/CheR fusion protein
MAEKKNAGRKSKVKKSRTADAQVEAAPEKTAAEDGFPMVGLGASAGGLEALKAFFSQVTPDSGMAYIVVVHLASHQPSLLPELLQKVTPVPVSVAGDDQPIAPDHIYVIPPNKQIGISEGRLRLDDFTGKHPTLPIDHFLRSLARDQGARAAAVILSGTGSDGTLGIKEIKANEGLVLAQSEASAAYTGMPRSAFGSGVVDAVQPPEAMPRVLVRFFTRHNLALPQKTAAAKEQQIWLNKIFTILRDRTGHDFSQYKVNTLLRRIGSRMGLNQIDDSKQYIRFLQTNPAEAEALFRDLLIGVTSFFRDPESFEVLKAKALPGILDQMPEDATLRAWIPGCSTGEEVYSLAMAIHEALDQNNRHLNLQLFGTDIDSQAIEKAREGIFPDSIAADVSAGRLARFFIKEGDFFRIRKDIRESVVFSVQDLIKDPPFSRLHLLCCRNLLIYLDAGAQKKLLPLFHYTLKPDGLLMLGTSETIGKFSNLFRSLDNKWKIFQRIEVPEALRQPIEFPSGHNAMPLKDELSPAHLAAGPKTDLAQLTRLLILDRFAPTAVLIDANGSILHVQGRTGKYLEPPSGPPTQNIVDMAREGLRIELSSAIRKAKTSQQMVIRRKISVKTNGKAQTIDLQVCPQQGPGELAGRLLVVFTDVATPPRPGGAQKTEPQDSGSSRVAELERELQSTRESHQTTVEELESSNEEIKSANEELQSTNEELQSTNEELESSKEELQSLNEELQTVNIELQSKLDELSAAQDDMRNLLNSTEIATLFVDNQLRIRRFTPEATAIINLIHTDIGRPLEHVSTNLTYTEMIADLQAVVKKLTPRQVEVQTAQGHWYMMRIMPYRTTDNRIDGAVLTFTSIQEQKKAQAVLNASGVEMKRAWQLVRDVFDENADPLAVLDADSRLVIANTAFARAMDLDPEKIEGQHLFAIAGGLMEKAESAARLKAALEKGEDFRLPADAISPSKSAGKVHIDGRIIGRGDERPYHILLRFVPS